LYAYGRRDPGAGLDRETGLPILVIAGCFVDEETLGRAHGHDERVREHIAAHGLPPSSRKAFEADLFDLRGYLSRAAPDLRDLEMNGSWSISHDGRLRVRVFRTDGESASIRAASVVEGGPAELLLGGILPRGFRDQGLVFAPGPRGSDTLVVRGQVAPKGSREIVLFGLRGEEGWLRVEEDFAGR
jgi:hypothetical protein